MRLSQSIYNADKCLFAYSRSEQRHQRRRIQRLLHPDQEPPEPDRQTSSKQAKQNKTLITDYTTRQTNVKQTSKTRPSSPTTQPDRQTSNKQTSKTRPSSPTTQPDSTRRAAPHRTVSRCPLQLGAAAHDARTAPTPPVTTRWPPVTHRWHFPDRQTSTSPRGGRADGWRRQCQWGPVVELHVSFMGLQVWYDDGPCFLEFGRETWTTITVWQFLVSMGDLFWPQWTPEG